jgi:hypothetical protein
MRRAGGIERCGACRHYVCRQMSHDVNNKRRVTVDCTADPAIIKLIIRTTAAGAAGLTTVLLMYLALFPCGTLLLIYERCT